MVSLWEEKRPIPLGGISTGSINDKWLRGIVQKLMRTEPDRLEVNWKSERGLVLSRKVTKKSLHNCNKETD